MQFTYRAKQDSRTEASGVVEATDLPSAVSHLKQMGLYPLEVVPLESPGESIRASEKVRPLSRRELVLWSRTVGQGLKAGLSLTQALHLLGQQETKRPLGFMAKGLEEKVVSGMSLGAAMEQMGKSFSPVAVSLARAGEASGALEQVLESLADETESEAELIAKVQGALIYPLFVLLVGMGTVCVLLWFVVPKLAVLFAETGQPLPWMTRLMIQSGRGLMWTFILGVAGSLLAFVVIRRAGLKVPFLEWGMVVLRRLPFFGRLIAQEEIARFSSLLALLLSHGLPLPDSLRLVGGTVGGTKLQGQVQQTQSLVIEGMSLSNSFRRVGIVEPFLLTMVAMGEAQGDLAQAFQQAAQRSLEDVNRGVKVLSTLIEPMMILLVGLVVGAIVFSMLLPIFQLNFTVG